MNLSDVLNRRLCLQQPVPACDLTHGWVTMLSDSQRVANFSSSFSFYSCMTMGRNPAFTVHATAHAFRAAINLEYVVLVTTSDLMFRKSFDL